MEDLNYQTSEEVQLQSLGKVELEELQVKNTQILKNELIEVKMMEIQLASSEACLVDAQRELRDLESRNNELMKKLIDLRKSSNNMK